MNEEDKWQSAVELAFQARALQENPIYRDAVELVKDRVWGGFIRTSPDDDKTRLALRMEYEALSTFKARVDKIIETGDVAQQELFKLNEQKKRVKSKEEGFSEPQYHGEA